MKKIFLIFLLLGSVVLAGCGDYEDEAPRVVWTSPENGAKNATDSGQVVKIKFSTAMQAASVDTSNVTVSDVDGNSWPGVDEEGASATNKVTTAWSEEGTLVIFTQDKFFKTDSCFELKISTNVRSSNGKTLEAPYIVNFGTDGKECP